MTFRSAAIHFLFVLILFVISAIGVVAVDYVLWTIYVGRLEGNQKPKTDTFAAVSNVSPETLRRLGYVLTGKESSFVHYLPNKADGVIRIGAFGDSFTYGDEVDEKNDYPTQLQRLLKDSGFPNVEVINFGTSWFGMGQTHIMWNEVGRNFGLDFILLGPATFFPDRDTRFNHTYGISPYSLHSRYVLEGGDVRLIDVPGETHSERFHNYYGFIPDRRFLSYDRGDPTFLAALMPSGKNIGNPFYYDKRSESAEAIDIQRRLLQNMKDSKVPILVAVYPSHGVIRQAMAGLTGENFCVTQFDRFKRFPYLAQWGHNSPSGNTLLAQQYLATLLGRPIDAAIINTKALDDKTPLPRLSGKLSSFDGVFIRQNGVEVGVFSPPSPWFANRKAPSFLRDEKLNSLIGFKAPGSSLVDGALIGLRSEVPADAPLRLVMQTQSGTSAVNLGKLRPLAIGLRLAQVDLPGFEVRDGFLGGHQILINLLDLQRVFGNVPSTALLQIQIGDKVVLEGRQNEKSEEFVLHPVDGQVLLIRGAPSSDLSATRGVEKGDVSIVLQRGSETFSIPIAQWWVDRQSLMPAPECAGLPRLTANTPPSDNLTVISITASGDGFDGAPQMRVYLDDKPIGSVEVTAARKDNEWQTFTFRTDVSMPPRVLEIQLVNDKYDSVTKADRNLYVKDVVIRGRRLRPEDATVTGYPSEGVPGQPRGIYDGSLKFTLDDPKNR